MVTELDSFTQLQGQPGWVDTGKQRLRDAVLEFGADGTIKFTTSNVRDDMFPVTGRFTDGPGRLTFQISNNVLNNISVNFVTIEGEVTVSDDGIYRTTVTLITGGGTATNSNSTPFGATSHAIYRGVMKLRRD